jgi:chromatin remodeling complex protein RSC6
MARAASKTTAPATPAPVTPAPVAAKKAKVAAPAPVAPVVAPVEEAVEVSSLTTKLADFGSKIQQLSAVVSLLKTEYKSLEKSVARELKAAAKASSKKKRSSGNRAPSGFVKPTRISDELALFLGKEKGTELARTTVSKEINAYIRANSLQDKANGRQINADAKLSKLLKLSKEDVLTYFNLQRFLKTHFIKAVPA